MRKSHIVLSLIFTLGSISSLNAINIVNLNSADDIKKYSQSKPLVCYLSLSCDLGTYQSDIFKQRYYDLDGVNLGVYNINSFPSAILNGFEIDLGYTIIIMGNKVVASGYKDASQPKDIGLNIGQRTWLSKKLKELNIPNSMNVPATWHAKPIDEMSTEIDLKKGNIAWFNFDDANDKSPAKSMAREFDSFTGIKNGTYFMDGKYTTYDKKAREALIIYTKLSKSIASESFSFGVNIKLDSKLQTKSRSEILTAASASIWLYRTSNDKVAVRIQADRKKPGQTELADTWEDYYLLNDVDFKMDEWMNFQFAVDYESKRLKIVVDGKRIDDILLTDEAIKLVRKPANFYGEGLIQFGNARTGVLLYGLADDFVFYNRALSGAELVALYRRDAKNQSANLVSTPPPPPKKSDDSLSNWVGAWETFWGSDGDKTTQLELSNAGLGINGSYNYMAGKLEGKVKLIGAEEVFSGTWSQKNGKKGWFAFTLSKDGSSFIGNWGYEGDTISKESWTGYRSVRNFGKSPIPD